MPRRRRRAPPQSRGTTIGGGSDSGDEPHDTPTSRVARLRRTSKRLPDAITLGLTPDFPASGPRIYHPQSYLTFSEFARRFPKQHDILVAYAEQTRVPVSDVVHACCGAFDKHDPWDRAILPKNHRFRIYCTLSNILGEHRAKLPYLVYLTIASLYPEETGGEYEVCRPEDVHEYLRDWRTPSRPIDFGPSRWSQLRTQISPSQMEVPRPSDAIVVETGASAPSQGQHPL